MRGILAAHQLPPTQHLCQSMNIEWPPPPAFGVTWASGVGWRSSWCWYLSLIFSPPFSSCALPQTQRAASQKVSGLQQLCSNFPSVHNKGVSSFFDFLSLVRVSPSRTRTFLFHNEKAAEGRVPIAIHFAFFGFFFVVFFYLCLTFTACLHNNPKAKKKKKSCCSWQTKNTWAHCNYIFYTQAHTCTHMNPAPISRTRERACTIA